MKNIRLLFLWVATILTINGSAEESENPKVLLDTTHGSIILELNPDKAPITVENFLSLVDQGFFDGLIFHRVIKGFMIQAGGFDQDLKQREPPTTIKNEANNGLMNEVGTIAMARTSDPDSASSQFFINTVDNENLNYSSRSAGYAVFGKVVRGMDVVRAIENVETQDNVRAEVPSSDDLEPTHLTLHDVPVEAIVITSANRVRTS